MTTIILGSQWGDEGKGKLTDILCSEAQICARAAVSLALCFCASFSLVLRAVALVDTARRRTICVIPPQSICGH